MEHHEEPVSTRDIASGTTGPAPQREDEPRFDREQAPAGEAGAPAGEAGAPAAEAEPPPAGASGEGDMGSLLGGDAQGGLVARWEEIQTRFVDDPRRAVEEADQLVATVMQRLADGFAEERERLEGMWGRGENVGTEDLRVTLQRYRSFFRRLLSA